MTEKHDDQTGRQTDGLLIPFTLEPFGKAVLSILIVTVLCCLMSRAPQLQLTDILGVKLPFELNAIIGIVLAPFGFAIVSFLLWQLACRSTRTRTWTKGLTAAVISALTLVAVGAVFLCAQYFLILCPSNATGDGCDYPHDLAHLDRLFSFTSATLKIRHTMGSAEVINKTAWYYTDPLGLQSCVNLLLTAVSLMLFFLAGRAWCRRPAQR